MSCDLQRESAFLEKIVKHRLDGKMRAAAARYNTPIELSSWGGLPTVILGCAPPDVFAIVAQQEEARVNFVIPDCAPHFNLPTRLRLIRRAQAAVLGMDC